MFILKKIFITVLLVIIAGSIGMIFWQQELQYAAPTPIPPGYVPVSVYTPLSEKLFNSRQLLKPVHLHFYNPDCPCSKFNLDHFQSLVNQYNHAVDFYIVLASADKYASVKEKFGNSVTVLIDKDESIAESCGVYSTPQAVILNQQGQLYYRGNYNKARYCTDKKTNYAQLALEALIAGKAAPVLGQLATTSYGCEISDKPQTLNFLNF